MFLRKTNSQRHPPLTNLAIAVSVLFVIGTTLPNMATAQSSTNNPRPNSGGSNSGSGGGNGVKLGIGILKGVGKIISDQDKKKKTRHKPKKTKTKGSAKKKSPSKKRKTANQPRVPVPAVKRDTVPNEIILSFASDAPRTLIDTILNTYGLRQLDEALIPLINKRIIRAFGADNLSPGRRRQLEADPRVSITNNYIYILSAKAPKQYAVKRLDLNTIHKTVTGNGILVAVIDSGVHIDHPAIKASITEQKDILAGKRKIADSHGTAVSSIIAAQSEMRGTAPGAQILSIRAFAPARKGKPAESTTFALVEALNEAFQSGAQIINMSFAGSSDELFEEAVEAAYGLGLVMVAAAGNQGPKAKPAYPAAYQQVIAVTATDKKDRLYKKANRGSYVAFAAPGVDILVAKNKQGYGFMSGTSMATAFVSGTVALMLENDPTLTADQISNLLALSADDLGSKGRDKKFGHGLINPNKALSANMLSSATAADNQTDKVASGSN